MSDQDFWLMIARVLEKLVHQIRERHGPAKTAKEAPPSY